MEVRRKPGTVTVQNVEKQQLHTYLKQYIMCIIDKISIFQVSKKGKCQQAVNTHSWVHSTTKS